MDRRIVLARVNAAIANGMSPARIGYLTLSDPGFVTKLRNGHAFRPSTLWRAYESLCKIDKPRKLMPGDRRPRKRKSA
jgi:hypothetical protein